VAFRSQHPDEGKVKEVLKELQDNKVDASQKLKFRADYCHYAEFSTEGGSSA
jgi:hypothetical protein